MNGAAIPFVAPLAALFLAAPLAAQVTLQVWTGLPSDSLFGVSVDTLGDVTGDGVSEVAVASHGRIYVLSGADGSTVYDFPALFGLVTRAGDMDGDGSPDLLVLSTGGSCVCSMVVQVRSGPDGALLLQVDDETDAHAVAAVSDVDGDGSRDLVIGTPSADAGPIYDAGRVALYSGADGSLLYALNGAWQQGYTGYMVADVGDVDEDGYGDFAFNDQLDSGVPLVRVVSGFDGETVLTFDAFAGRPELWAVDDLDGDGRLELAMSGSFVEPGLTHFRIVSTATWEELLVIPGGSDKPIRVGDVDGDGRPDIGHGHWEPSVEPRALRISSMATGAKVFDLDHPDDEGDWFGRELAPLQDLDGDGRVEFVTSLPAFDGNAGCVALVSLVPASIGAVQPGSVTMAELSELPVRVLGQGLEYADEVHVGDQVLTLDDPAVTAVGFGELVLQPSPSALGTVPISVLNHGMPESNALPLTFAVTHPPVLATDAVAFTGAGFGWKLFGGAGHTGLLLLAATPSTFTLKGWTVLREFILITSVPLDAVGTGGLQVIVPPAAAGLAFYSQFVTVQGSLVGATNIILTLVIF